MKSIGIHIALLVVVALPLAAAQKAEPQPVTIPAGSAMVAEVKGSVSVLPPHGTLSMARRGMVLAAETTIETGKGSVMLSLADGSQVLVKSMTRIVLKSEHSGDGYSLQMLIGEILAKVKKRLGETPPFRMGTPSAVITVRGTRFSVEVDKKGKTTVEVFEGIVEVEGLGEKPRAVLVRPGFRTEVEPGGQPQLPQPINQFGLMGPAYGPTTGIRPGIGQPPGGSQPTGSEDKPGNKPEGPDK